MLFKKRRKNPTAQLRLFHVTLCDNERITQFFPEVNPLLEKSEELGVRS